MSKYEKIYSAEFEKDLKKIKSDFDRQKRLRSKINEILEDPHHYKPLRNVLKNRSRTHIGSFVLIFEIGQKKREVTFHSFKHHDKAYK